jgi:hypothetical protein
MLCLGLILVFAKVTYFGAKLVQMRVLRVKHAVQKEFWLTTKLLRSALFWDITQGAVIIPYRRFGVTYRSHLQSSRYGRKNFVWNYDYLLRKDSEERRSRLLRGGSLI